MARSSEKDVRFYFDQIYLDDSQMNAYFADEGVETNYSAKTY